MSKTKVHKVVLLIVDHDNVGVNGIAQVLQDANYPNDCISPKVMGTETTEVMWSDKHPLNNGETVSETFEELFR